MKQITLLALVLGMGFSSCVSTKKHAALQADFNALKDNQKQTELEKNDLATEKANLLKKLEDEENRIAALEEDTTKVGAALRRKKKAYDDLNETYFLLASKSSSTMAKQAEENRILLEDIRSREKKVNELEALIEEKESLLNGLKDKVSSALNSFDGKGLTIENRDGKIYVSLENSLLFKSGSWKVDKKGKSALDKLAAILVNHPDINVMIEGHTDNVPYKGQTAVKDNWDLSVMRATAIVKILMETNGIGESRITAAGRSEYQPIAPNTDKVGRAKNRRIDIILSPDLKELNQVLQSDTEVQ